MARQRSHSIEFKRQVAREFVARETLYGLAKRHDLQRQLIRVWVQKYEAGALDEDAQAADLLKEYEAKIVVLERMVGRQALEIEFLKGGTEKRSAAAKRDYIRYCRPAGISVAEGCRLMGIARSTFYDRPDAGADDAAVVAQMKAICDEFETYGYRRVGAELRHRGIVVNAKKVRRLMREHALNPKRHRRFIATTNSNHNYPICPNLATSMTLNGPNQLWVADITYVAITNCFVYLAVILDAWSRRVVGYAISR